MGLSWFSMPERALMPGDGLDWLEVQISSSPGRTNERARSARRPNDGVAKSGDANKLAIWSDDHPCYEPGQRIPQGR